MSMNPCSVVPGFPKMWQTSSAMSCSSNARLPVIRDTRESVSSPPEPACGVRVARKVRIRRWSGGNSLMLWALVVLLLLLWIGGFTLNVAGGLIHLLLVIAIVVAIYNLVVSRGRTI